MPTSTQLAAEPYWGREIVTPELDWLGDELCRRTGRPRTAFGSKGNNVHLNGAHRSQEWIKRSRYCTNRTYTVQTGLTAEQERHIAGADFTPGDWGSTRNRALMVVQTGRLVAALKAGRLSGVREVIGTLDGRTVVGTRANGSTFRSDGSHLDHWHLTFDRRHCRDQQLMARIIATALGTDPEDEMTPKEFVTLLRDPAVARTLRATPWQYTGGGIPSGMSTLGVLDQTYATSRAILAAVTGQSSAEQILAAIRAEAELTRAALLAQVRELAPGLAQAVAEQLGPEAAAGEIGEAIAAELGRMLAGTADQGQARG